MKIEVVLRQARVLALSALLATCQAAAAQEGGLLGAGGNVNIGADERSSARVVLPTPTGAGRPYRQTKSTTCAESQCIMPFNKVPANRLLEIQTITCLSLNFGGEPFGNGIIATVSEITDVSQIVAILPPQVLSTRIVIGQHGTYYFRPEERPYVHVAGDDGQTAICTLSGVLHPIRP